MKAKPGQLKMGWSKREKDISYAWGGDGASKNDATLLHAILTMPIKHFDKTFQQMLVERGYDITTIKFSIQKKQEKGLESE